MLLEKIHSSIILNDFWYMIAFLLANDSYLQYPTRNYK